MLLVCANLIQIDCLLCRGRPKKKKNNENLNFCFSWFESGKLLQESFKIQISLDFQHLFFRGLAGILKSCEPLLRTALIMPLNKTHMPIWCTYIFSDVPIWCTYIFSDVPIWCTYTVSSVRCGNLMCLYLQWCANLMYLYLQRCANLMYLYLQWCANLMS